MNISHQTFDEARPWRLVLRTHGSWSGMYKISLARKDLDKGFLLILSAGPVVYTARENQFVVPLPSLQLLDDVGVHYKILRKDVGPTGR